MAKRTLAKDLDKYVVRLPDGMRDRLQEAADEKGLSLNAEIVSRLEFAESLPRIRDDFELAKDRILGLQKLSETREQMANMLQKALSDAQDREKALQAQIERLTGLLEKKLS